MPMPRAALLLAALVLAAPVFSTAAEGVEPLALLPCDGPSREIWRTSLPSGNETTTARDLVRSPDGGRLFVSSRDTYGTDLSLRVRAFAATSGALLWNVSVRQGAEGSRSFGDLHPSPDGATLYVIGTQTLPGGESRPYALALDAEDGERIFSVVLEPSNSRTVRARGAEVAGDRIYVAGSSQATGALTEGYVMALDRATGALLWSQAWGLAASSDEGEDVALTPDGARVLITGRVHNASGATAGTWPILRAYDASSGALVYATQLAKGFEWGHRVVVAQDGVAYISIKGVTPRFDIEAVQASTGVSLWRRGMAVSGNAAAYRPEEAQIIGANVLHAGYLFDAAGVGGTHVLALTRSSGATAWTASATGGPFNGRIAVSSESDRVYVAAYPAVAIGLANGRRAWEVPMTSLDVEVAPDGSRAYYVHALPLDPTNTGGGFAVVALRTNEPLLAPCVEGSHGGAESGIATLSWATREGRDLAQGWRVWRGATPTSLSVAADLSGSVRSYSSGGHAPGERVYLQVAETQGAAQGPRSDVVLVRLPGPPSPPLDVDADPGTSLGQLVVRWSPPEWDGALDLVSYRVYRSVGNEPLKFVGEVGAGTLEFREKAATIDILASHTYVIRAVNTHYLGEASAPSCAMPSPWPFPEGAYHCATQGLG